MNELTKQIYPQILRLKMISNIMNFSLTMIFLAMFVIVAGSLHAPDTMTTLAIAIPVITYPIIFILNLVYSGILTKKYTQQYAFWISGIRKLSLKLFNEREFDDAKKVANFDLLICRNFLVLTWIWTISGISLNLIFNASGMGYALIAFIVLNAIKNHFLMKPTINHMRTTSPEGYTTFTFSLNDRRDAFVKKLTFSIFRQNKFMK